MKQLCGTDLSQRRLSSFFQGGLLFLLLCGLGRAGAAIGLAADASELRAGLAKIDVTPSQPVKMAGYEARKELSQGVHDPLGARALALEHEGRRLVLVSLDNVGFYGGVIEPLRNAILEACHLQPSELFLCAIHTHSAPALTLDAEKGARSNLEYTKTLQSKLADLVRSALERLEPAQATVGIGSSPIGVNRREVVHDNVHGPAHPVGLAGHARTE